MSKKSKLAHDLRVQMNNNSLCERHTTRIRHGKEVEVYLPAVENKTTQKGYKASVKQFCGYCASKGIYWADLQSMGLEQLKKLIEDYQFDYLYCEKKYTDATMHTKLAPVCRALDVDMGDISKSKRLSKNIVRGRNPEANHKGQLELKNPRYEKLVAFQKAVGIRRDELAHLKGCDLCIEPGGAMYVVVRRGKGGKTQYQWIMPKDRELVKSYFDGSDQPVFGPDRPGGQIPIHANLHGLRADHAWEMYNYFAQGLTEHPGQREQVKAMLIHYAEKHGSAKNVEAVRTELAKDKAYKLRGDTAKLAKMYGKPDVLDRVAIMAVSVLGLAHWRSCVTVVNYLIRPDMSGN